MNKPHLENFFLSEAFLNSLTESEVEATFEAMCECDIARAPFEEFCITVPEAIVIRSSQSHKPFPDAELRNMEFHYLNVTGNLSQEVGDLYVLFRVYSHDLTRKRRSLDWIEALNRAYGDKHEQYVTLKGRFQLYAAHLLRYLIVSLASRGVQKVREKNKLAALGIGKNRPGGKYAYTTTISVGHVEADESEPGHTGRTVRAHLRRGHVRHQHFGPNMSFVKKIFIEAVFVNSDKEYVSFRDRYNVSLTPTTTEAKDEPIYVD